MKGVNLTFDEGDLRFSGGSRGFGARLLAALKWLLLSALVVVACYVVYALVFWTGDDARLRRENRSMARNCEQVEKSVGLLEEEVEFLRARDEDIYQAVFNSSAPSLASLPLMKFTLEGQSDADILSGSRVRLDAAVAAAARIEANFRNICMKLEDNDFVMPPMAMPVEGFSLARTGASVGQKMSPFYKVETAHNGFDIISLAGTPVVASGPGTVRKVIRSGQALGNMVVVSHGNGYVTRYGHLADIRVSEGTKVRRGSILGYVGLSGQSYAPHLHYEVLRDTLVCNPVDYLFATVTPEEYASMLILSGETGQSMD